MRLNGIDFSNPRKCVKCKLWFKEKERVDTIMTKNYKDKVQSFCHSCYRKEVKNV